MPAHPSMKAAMVSRPVRVPSPDRVHTPEEISTTPVSSRWAHSAVIPKGARAVPSTLARPGRKPEVTSIWITTVKKTTKAQMFRVERKEFFTAPVKAAVNRWALKGGAVPPRRRPSSRRP